MSKAILVIDMPESCGSCDICFLDEYSYFCSASLLVGVLEDVYEYVRGGTKPDWCPLKLAPEKKLPYITSSDYLNGFGSGYNACIDDIISK